MQTDTCVIITTYNRLRYIKECLRSVLSQTAPPDELVIIDGGSSDGSLEWLRSEHSGLKIISAKNNPGPSVLMNLGLGETRSQFVAFLESDDNWRPSYLEKMAAALHASSALCLHCDFTAIDDAGRILISARRGRMPAAAPNILRRLGPESPVGRALAGCTRLSFTMFRREAFSILGGFDPSYQRVCHDVDFLFRLAQRCGAEAFSWLDEDLGIQRIHAGQLSRQKTSATMLDRAWLSLRHPPALRDRISDKLCEKAEETRTRRTIREH
ncbi:MAG TPA: glycosyltransferase [Elusimicrobiota bacterium]|nr:glycosyltransferase [Elusimicrobiota bacterium]